MGRTDTILGDFSLKKILVLCAQVFIATLNLSLGLSGLHLHFEDLQ